MAACWNSCTEALVPNGLPPWHGRLAWGVDVNHVRQRDFCQGLQFRDYRVSTGETAIKAAAYTLGASFATRYVMGRSRPTDGLGNTHFGGFKSSAWQSGLPSNHVAVAFALATPFAQQHDMPWLYGVAAATAFGRVQKRQHWVSDTVAGAAMGYAIGSLLTEQERGDKGMRLSVTPQSVSASWAFK
jgi:PAP2 superfamily/Exopolysaccharide biosynthesis protein YbjH